MTWYIREHGGPYRLVMGGMDEGVNPETGAFERYLRRFKPETQQRTANCLYALHRTTTEEELLRLAGGNKWIARRAIELYKLNLEICGYSPSADMDRPYFANLYTVKT